MSRAQDDHAPLPLHGLDVPVRFGGQPKWETSVDDGLDLPRLDQRFDREQVLEASGRKGADHPPAAGEGRPDHRQEMPRLEAGVKHNAAGLERMPVAREGRQAQDVEDDVVGLAAGEVLFGVIDGPVRAQGRT